MVDVLAFYWDASALLSVLVEDAHTLAARKISSRPGLHLISSLAHVEASAVLHRLARQGVLPSLEAARLLDGLEHGPWRHSPASPSRKVLRTLNGRHPLRGADLWHLALLLTLGREHHPFALVSYDLRLIDAAVAEGIALPPSR
jgi:predicted nucleic acid-binding protein